MSFIITDSGRTFYFDDRIGESDVRIQDIASSLAKLCRFTGHISGHYSVAQHSVLVSYLVPKEYAMLGLLHDAHEAYIGDINTPFKHTVPGLKEAELRIQCWVLHKLGELDITEFCGGDPIPKVVHEADRELLSLEGDQRMHKNFMKYVPAPTSKKILVKYMERNEAHMLFMARYAELLHARKHG